MKPTVLIESEVPVAAPIAKPFTMEKGETTTLFAQGLADLEEVVIEVLTNDIEPHLAAEEDWVWAAVLTATIPSIRFEQPGSFRMRIAASAGAVAAGMY